ncbi:MAG: response regulator, partial [Vicinamibacterales bacterium]
PEEALEWVRRGDAFDIGLLDVQLPGMDGLTLARKLREQRNADSLPLILLTSVRQRTAILRADRCSTLLKSIKPAALFEALLAALPSSTVRSTQPSAAGQFDAGLGERFPMRILLAEDNVVNQKVASVMLGKFGYRVDIVGNGQEALDALQRQSYDVILMDVQMPEMDGLEATRRICLDLPAGQRPEIIAMTANARAEDVAECLGAGMDSVLTKPVSVDDLRSLLKGAIARKKAKP